MTDPQPSSGHRADLPSDALLRQLSGALAPLLDPDEVVRVAVDTTVDLLGAVAGAVVRPSPDGTGVRIAYARHYPASLVSALEQLPLSRFPGAERLLRDRQPVFFDTPEAVSEALPGGLALSALSGPRAAIPLIVGDTVHGALVVSLPRDRTMTAADRGLLLAAAQQCAIAVDRALLFVGERRAREDAQHAATTLRESLDHMTDMHFVADEGWRYVRLNLAMRDYLSRMGIEPDSLVGREMWERFPLLQGGPMHRAMIESRRTGRAVPFSARGTYLASHYEGHAYPVNGGTAVIVHDIAEQERVRFGEHLLAEAGESIVGSTEMRQAIAQLAQRVVPSMADILVVFVRREGGSIGVVALETADPQAFEALQAFDRRFPIDHTPWHPVWTPLKEGRSVLIEDSAAFVESTRSSGDIAAHEIGALVTGTRSTSMIMVPLQARGHVLGAMGMGTQGDRRCFDGADLALAERLGHLAALALDNLRLLDREQRAREDAERARAVAERASQAKSDFLAMMSHELRTPLNAIGGYAELLELGLRGAVTNEQVTDLQKIRRNQRHLLGIINSVLTFVRLDAGRVVYDVANVPLASCMGSIESLVEPQLRARRLRYACHFPSRRSPCAPTPSACSRCWSTSSTTRSSSRRRTAPSRCAPRWTRARCASSCRIPDPASRRTASRTCSNRSCRPAMNLRASRAWGSASPSAGNWRAAWGATSSPRTTPGWVRPSC